MSETYTQEELARAWGEVDSLLGEDYRSERLAKICLQARKNRLWEAHGNVELVQHGITSIDEMKAKLDLPPWVRGDEGDSPAAG